MSRSLAAVACALALTLAGSARADEPRDEPTTTTRDPADDPQLGKWPIIVLEQLLVIVPPTIYYWDTPDQQKEDWALDWDWRSWRAKLLTTDALVLDTNRFDANGVRHPLVGALTYQIGRANGLSPAAALAMDFALSWFWEYVVEFKEQPSINDLVANSAGGLLLGEPLFQIGLVGDVRGASLARRALAGAVSPFDATQRELHLVHRPRADAPASRLEVFAGMQRLQQTDAIGGSPELRLGIDLETFHDPAFGRPGHDARWTRFAAWNRVTGTLTLGGPEQTVGGGALRSTTTLLGRFGRSLDELGRGRQTFLGLGVGFDVVDRRLPTEWDEVAVFQLAQPRAAVWWTTPHAALDLEASASADLAMVESQALGTMPRVPDSSIVLSRGYYYGTGISVQARARVRRGRWSAELESVAHQLWSFDEHDHGGSDDPKDLADSRVTTTAIVGVRPFARDDVRVEAYVADIVRRGTGDNLYRETREREAGLAIRAGF